MKWFRKFGRLVVALFFVACASVALYTLSERAFRIEIVEITGANVQVLLNEQKIDKNLLFFPTEKIRAQLLQDNPLIKDIQIRKKFPHTLEIIASARTPVARLQLLDRSLLVDQDGVVVVGDSWANSSLPLIRIDVPPLGPGGTLTDGRIRQSLAFVTLLGQDLAISEISELDTQSLRAKWGKTDIYFPQNSDIVDKVATLQTLISGFRIKGILPKVIDLRFDKPIVTFY